MTRTRIFLAAGIIAAVAACAAAGIWLVQCQARYARAGADLDSCARSAARICQCRQSPAMAAEQERQTAATNGPIESAAKAAGVPLERIVRISHEPPRWLGDTPYKEKPTQVIMKGVTLRQFFALAGALANGPEPLALASVRLAAPGADDTGDLWNVELTLTYLIFDPSRSQK